MNSESKWETTSSKYGLLEGEYVNLIATMCVTDSNSKPFTFKPIAVTEDIQEDLHQEDNENDESIMADKGKNFSIFFHWYNVMSAIRYRLYHFEIKNSS